MTLINADQLDTSPVDYVVQDLIPRGGIGIVWGPSTWGKSLVISVEMALAIANGTPFFGHETLQGSVIVALGEGLLDAGIRKEARIGRQASEDAAAVAALRAHRGDAAADAFAASLPAYTDDRLFTETQPFTVPLSQQGVPDRTMVAAAASYRQIPDLEVLILDAMTDFSNLSITNDTSANRYIQGMKWLARELDCLVLAVAHPTKKGGEMMGSGRLFNASDFVIEVIPETGTAPDAPKAATLTCRKSKYGPGFDPISYEIDEMIYDSPVLDDDGVPVPGVTVPVKTATVRLRADADTGALRMPGTVRPPRPLPVVRDVPRPRKRTGLRLVPTLRGTAVGAVALVALAVAVPHHHPVPAAATAAYTVSCQAPVPAPVQAFVAACKTVTAAPAAKTTAATTPAPATGAAAKAHHRLLHSYIAHRLVRHLVPRVRLFPRLYLFPRPHLFRAHYLFRF